MGARFTLLVAAFAFALGPAVASAADKKVNLRLSYWVPPKHKLTPAYKEWSDHLKKATAGTVSFTLFPSSQLGSGRDHYDMVKRGVADIGLINPGYTPGRFPVHGAIDLPFMVSNMLRGAKAMTRFYMKYAAKEMGDVKVCHVFSHDPGSFHTTKKVTVPADLKGMKIRTANATMAAYVTAMGGNSVQVPIMEAFETLKRGITDGLNGTWASMITFNFGKVVKHHLDAPIYVASFVHTINLKKYDSLSPAQKKAFDATCTPEWASRIVKYWDEQEVSLAKAFRKDSSQHFNKIGAKELALWRKATEPVYKQWAEAVKAKGYDPDALLTELRAELKKENALAE